MILKVYILSGCDVISEIGKKQKKTQKKQKKQNKKKKSKTILKYCLNVIERVNLTIFHFNKLRSV